MKLKDKVVLVTGGTSGLGKAVVQHFLTLGAKLAVFDITPMEENDPNFKSFIVDVCDSEAVKNHVSALVEHFGSLDICINCAGVAPAQKILDRDDRANSTEEFSRVIDVNLKGTYNVCTAAAEVMAQNHGDGEGERGLIINTSSIAAYEGQKGQCAYAASKGGIASMTLPMARDLSVVGIRAVAIAPGVMATPMMLAMPEKVQEGLRKSIPFPKRLGLPEEFAALAAHIAENPYINGEVIRLDGSLRMG